MYIAYKQSNNYTYTAEQRKLFREEAIQSGEKILASCTQDEVRNSAIQVVSFAYSDMGETEKAEALAQKMPHMAVCRQVLMSMITTGDKKLEAQQTELHLYVQFLEKGIGRMNNCSVARHI